MSAESAPCATRSSLACAPSSTARAHNPRKGSPVPSPSSVLPNAAREQCWRLLWERLLRPIPDGIETGSEPANDAPDSEPRDDENTEPVLPLMSGTEPRDDAAGSAAA